MGGSWNEGEVLGVRFQGSGFKGSVFRGKDSESDA